MIEMLLTILCPFLFLSSNTHLLNKLDFFHNAVRAQSKHAKKVPILITFILAW